MAILRFTFSAIGETRESVLDELDSAVRVVMEQIGGEPWLTITDDVKKMQIGPGMDPGAYAYIGAQEVVFAGPTVLGKDIEQFRDGFRPQGGDGLGGGPLF